MPRPIKKPSKTKPVKQVQQANNRIQPNETQMPNENAASQIVPRPIDLNYPCQVYLEKIKKSQFWKEISEAELQKELKNIAHPVISTNDVSEAITYDEFKTSALNVIEDYEKSIANHENEENSINEENEENDEQVDDEPEYSVEKIVSKNVINGIIKYECKWQNYDDNDNTYEKIHNLVNSLILAKSFENNLFFNPKVLKKGQIMNKFIDINHLFSDTVWKTLKHLQEIDKILSYDTYSGLCWVSFKNVCETAKVHCDTIKKKYPQVWLDFFRENREEFIKGRVPPIEVLYKKNLKNNPDPVPSTSRARVTQ